MSPLRRGSHEHTPGHVFHWRHGWVPLDYRTALHAAGGNPRAANRMLEAAHAPDAGINTPGDVERAARTLPTITRADERARARRAVVFAAQEHDAQDVIPRAWQKPRPESHRTLNLDQIEQKMTAAVEAGDDAAVDRYAGMMEKREAHEKTTANNKERKREDAHRARSDHYDELVQSGQDDEQAYSTAFGVPLDTMRREQAISLLGGSGSSSTEFRRLSTVSYHELADRDWRAAEDATNGYLLTRQGERKGIDARTLWSSNEATARKYASPELRDWWDQHGRVTLAEHQQDLIDPKGAARTRHARADFLQ